MNRKRLMLAVILLSALYLFWDIHNGYSSYIMYRRSTRLLAVYFVVSLITISSLLFQLLSHNRLLTPSLLGFDKLYMLIASVGIFVGITRFNSSLVIILQICLMVFLATVFYIKILKKLRQDVYRMLLVGTILNALFGAMVSLLGMMMDPNEFSILQQQSLASFNAIKVESLLLCMGLSIPGFVLYTKIRYQLDVLSLGDDMAVSLGIDIVKLRKQVLIIISLFVSITTVLAGPITFLGMIITNLAYQMDAHKHRALSVTAIALGVILMLISQLVVDHLFAQQGSISVMINIVGGIYFIYLMLKERQHD